MKAPDEVVLTPAPSSDIAVDVGGGRSVVVPIRPSGSLRLMWNCRNCRLI